MKTLHDLPELNGKRVIVRVDFNVPLDENGNVTGDQRIRIALPTLRRLLDGGAARVIVMTHVGRPKGNEPGLRTHGIAARLSELLGVPVKKVDDWGESGLPDDRVVMLENLRFHPGEKSKDPAEREAFARQLAGLADLYVDDAFANLHRDHASMTGVPKLIPGYAGLAVEGEVAKLRKAIADPERPFVAVMGGLKADKLTAVSHLLDKADHIVMGGALAYALLSAMGKQMGASRIDTEGLSAMSELVEKIKKSDKIHLPVDAVIADRFAEDAERKVVSVASVPDGWMVLDIGPRTVSDYLEILKTARTIIWFGPIGVFEMAPFAEGTKAIGRAMAESPALTIVGGGDSASAAEALGYADRMSLVSTGGGASLQIIEGATLPGIAALN